MTLLIHFFHSGRIKCLTAPLTSTYIVENITVIMWPSRIEPRHFIFLKPNNASNLKCVLWLFLAAQVSHIPAAQWLNTICHLGLHKRNPSIPCVALLLTDFSRASTCVYSVNHIDFKLTFCWLRIDFISESYIVLPNIDLFRLCINI